MGVKFTIGDGIVKDSLVAVGAYNRLEDKVFPGTLVVSGGIATQLYAQQGNQPYFRPSHDVDLVSDKIVTKQYFRDDFSPFMVSQLKKYPTSVKPESHHVREIQLTDAKGRPLFIHTYESIEFFHKQISYLTRSFCNYLQPDLIV